MVFLNILRKTFLVALWFPWIHKLSILPRRNPKHLRKTSGGCGFHGYICRVFNLAEPQPQQFDQKLLDMSSLKNCLLKLFQIGVGSLDNSESRLQHLKRQKCWSGHH